MVMSLCITVSSSCSSYYDVLLVGVTCSTVAFFLLESSSLGNLIYFVTAVITIKFHGHNGGLIKV